MNWYCGACNYRGIYRRHKMAPPERRIIALAVDTSEYADYAYAPLISVSCLCSCIAQFEWQIKCGTRPREHNPSGQSALWYICRRIVPSNGWIYTANSCTIQNSLGPGMAYFCGSKYLWFNVFMISCGLLAAGLHSLFLQPCSHLL